MVRPCRALAVASHNLNTFSPAALASHLFLSHSLTSLTIILFSTEFEGLGAGDVSGGAGSTHTDDDMHDLFRSFLVDSEDLLNVPSSQGSHAGVGQAATAPTSSAPTPTDLPGQASFGFRNAQGGGGRGGVTYEADDGVRGMRRRANTSPECEDTGRVSSTQVCANVFMCVILLLKRF